MNKNNISKAESCEISVKKKLKQQCKVVIPLTKGADFLCIENNGDVRFIEVKCNNSTLTKSQQNVKKIAEKFQIDYEVVRCGC